MILSDVEECLAKAERVSDSSRPLLAAVILLFTLIGVIINSALLAVLIWHWRSKLRSQMLLILSWLLPIVITLGSTALGCQKRYNRYSLAYTFACSDCTMFWGISFLDFNQYAGQSIPLIMITAYAIILFSVYRSRKSRGGFNRQQSLADAKLALQFIIICCAQYLSTLLFFVIPKVGHSSNWSVLLLNTIGTINVSVNPIVLLLWNQQIRSSAVAIFGRRQVRANTNATLIISIKPGTKQKTSK